MKKYMVKLVFCMVSLMTAVSAFALDEQCYRGIDSESGRYRKSQMLDLEQRYIQPRESGGSVISQTTPVVEVNELITLNYNNLKKEKNA